jgi:hypothetical protein
MLVVASFLSIDRPNPRIRNDQLWVSRKKDIRRLGSADHDCSASHVARVDSWYFRSFFCRKALPRMSRQWMGRKRLGVQKVAGRNDLISDELR